MPTNWYKVPCYMLRFAGASEILVTHASFCKAKKEEGGRLFVVSGATGKVVGRYMDIPRNREIHVSPVLHTTFDRSRYILFGSGGIGDTRSDGMLARGMMLFFTCHVHARLRVSLRLHQLTHRDAEDTNNLTILGFWFCQDLR